MASNWPLMEVLRISCYLQELRQVGDELGIKAVVLRGEELEARGFGGKTDLSLCNLFFLCRIQDNSICNDAG